MSDAPNLAQMAEQSVLGSLLQDNSRFAEVAELVDAGSFGHRPYGAIFAAVADLIGRHELADELAVCQWLRDAGREDETGGLPHLAELSGSVVSGSRAAVYAQRVAEFARLRALADLAADMPAIIDRAETADAAVDQLQGMLATLQR